MYLNWNGHAIDVSTARICAEATDGFVVTAQFTAVKDFLGGEPIAYQLVFPIGRCERPGRPLDALRVTARESLVRTLCEAFSRLDYSSESEDKAFNAALRRIGGL